MRDDQHGGAVLSVDILQQHQNISGGFGIQRSRGFIAQQKAGILISALAMAQRCCCPPDSCAGNLF